MNIGDALYQLNNLSLNPQTSTAKTAETLYANQAETTANQDSNTSDAYKLTLSPEVEYAKTRELLGLPPTGKLSLADFQTSMEQDQQTLNNGIGSILSDLGLPADLSPSLSLDEDGKIVSQENFSGSQELEDALNSDDTLVQTFKRLNTNHEILNYISNAQSDTTNLNLLTAMDQTDNQGFLTQIASEYEAVTKTQNPLETLIQLGGDEDPYTFEYGAES